MSFGHPNPVTVAFVWLGHETHGQSVPVSCINPRSPASQFQKDSSASCAEPRRTQVHQLLSLLTSLCRAVLSGVWNALNTKYRLQAPETLLESIYLNSSCDSSPCSSWVMLGMTKSHIVPLPHPTSHSQHAQRSTESQHSSGGHKTVHPSQHPSPALERVHHSWLNACPFPTDFTAPDQSWYWFLISLVYGRLLSFSTSDILLRCGFHFRSSRM